jgi:hypothetical protein
MTYRIFNFAAFYAGWFACLLGVANGVPFLGPLVIAALLAFHLWASKSTPRETQFVLAVGAIGTALDTVHLSLGVYSLAGRPEVWLCPPWLTALWMIFASTFSTSLGWLAERYLLAAILGGFSGPLSYYAAARLGVISFSHPAYGLAALAASWAAAMPVLLVVNRKMRLVRSSLPLS